MSGNELFLLVCIVAMLANTVHLRGVIRKLEDELDKKDGEGSSCEG
jgi:hypothetical protein